MESGYVNIKDGRIEQFSTKAVINWRDFDIAQNDTLKFVQPNNNAVILNRVTSNVNTKIYGAIEANGRVIISNPQGIFIADGAHINVNEILLTTASIGTSDFLPDENMLFSGSGFYGSGVQNDGNIVAERSALLISPKLISNNLIKAKKVEMKNCDKFTLRLSEGDIFSFVISEAATETPGYLEHRGLIDAEGGEVFIGVEEGINLIESLIIISGEVKAPVVEKQAGGRVTIQAPTQHYDPHIINEYGEIVHPYMESFYSEGRDPEVYKHKVKIDGIIDVSGTDSLSQGGVVHILGENISVSSRSKIYANGYTDSFPHVHSKKLERGCAFCNWNLQGAEDEFLNKECRGGGSIVIGVEEGGMSIASSLFVGKAAIYAEGKKGDGGRVILMSNYESDLSPYISVVGDNGGFIKMSSKGILRKEASCANYSARRHGGGCAGEKKFF